MPVGKLFGAGRRPTQYQRRRASLAPTLPTLEWLPPRQAGAWPIDNRAIDEATTVFVLSEASFRVGMSLT